MLRGPPEDENSDVCVYRNTVCNSCRPFVVVVLGTNDDSSQSLDPHLKRVYMTGVHREDRGARTRRK